MSVVELFPKAKAPAPDDANTPKEQGSRTEIGEGSHAPSKRRRRRTVSSTAAAIEILAQVAPDGRHAVRAGARPDPVDILARAAETPTVDRFWAIWMTQQDFLRRRSLRLFQGNRADAEDALSIAMLHAAQAYTRRPVRNPRAWLLRILYNACMDQYRQKAVRVDLGEAVDAPSSPDPLWMKPPPSPEDLLSQAQLQTAWTKAVSALPPVLIDPLRLYLDDWPDEAIAAHLGISRELVRKRRQIAKDRLRDLLVEGEPSRGA
jgi:RNA polymerase sigma factor (sigma-70 family)